MGIREHIADIVEGGKEAFRKRERKYGFKQVLNEQISIILQQKAN